MNDQPQIEVDPTSKLPLDLCLEILFRLPVKSLICLKCVSKSWLSVISSPNFAKLHLRYSLSKPHYHGVLIHTRLSFYVVPNYSSFECGSERADLDQVKVNLGHHDIHGSFDVLGSCNGLILLKVESGGLRVWNPFTRESRDVSIPLFTYLYSKDLSAWPKYRVTYKFACPLWLWAFGYIPSLDDYKIVDMSKAAYRFYSLRTSAWRTHVVGNLMRGWTQDCIPSRSTQPGLVLPNAKAYWLLVKHSVGSVNLRLLMCDLVTETISGIQVPDAFVGVGSKYFCEHACLGVIEEDLCIVSHDESLCLQVWVLENNGDGELWKKFLKISGVVRPSAWNLKFCASCSTEKGGKFLMLSYGDVWLSNWGEGDEIAQCVQFEDRFTLHMDQFIATLVSPFLLENV